MAYEVKLEVFQGPIDLLLHLITRQRLDIYEVSLAQITDEFVQVTKELTRTDLERATGFLVVAASLLELKSARLLPSRRVEDLDPHLLEERDLLLARLVECATFRDAGAWLGRLLASGETFHGRSAGLEPQFEGLVPELRIDVTRDQLASIAERVLASPADVDLDTSHVRAVAASVRDAIADVADQLRRRVAVTFEELCADAPERIDVVVRFLALLELFKAGAVDIEQSDRFGRIRTRWTGAVDLDTVLADADDYAVAGDTG